MEVHLPQKGSGLLISLMIQKTAQHGSSCFLPGINLCIRFALSPFLINYLFNIYLLFFFCVFQSGLFGGKFDWRKSRRRV